MSRCTHCSGFGGHEAYASQNCPKCGLPPLDVQIANAVPADEVFRKLREDFGLRPSSSWVVGDE